MQGFPDSFNSVRELINYLQIKGVFEVKSQLQPKENTRKNRLFAQLGINQIEKTEMKESDLFDDEVIKNEALGSEKSWKKIGEGGFSEVYLTTLCGANVAIKKYNIEIDITSPHVKKELRTLRYQLRSFLVSIRKIRHPKIIAMVGVCLKPLLLVMEHMPGGSLFTVLHKTQAELPFQKKLQIACDIVSAIKYLHEREVIHRDLKSMNVLVLYVC